MPLTSNFLNNLKAEVFFLYAAFFAGLAFIFITPPFQVPDEPSHFYRAWQISEGTFSSVKENNRVGGDLPINVVRFKEHFNDLQDLKYQRSQIKAGIEIPSETGRQFIDFNNTALYSPICYAPAALSIFIFRSCGIAIFYNFYLARFFNLCFWIWMIYFMLRRLPAFKWLFCLLALLPMSLFINASLSADVVTNAICFLFVGTLLRFAYGTDKMSLNNLLLLLLLTFMVVSVKVIYAPLIILLLVIPSEKFKSKQRYYCTIALLFLIGALTALFWSRMLDQLYISYDSYNEQYRDKVALVYGADMHRQMEHAKTHGSQIFQVMLNSVEATFGMFFFSFVGTFGWLNILLPEWLVWGMYMVIVFVAITEYTEYIIVRPQHRILYFLAFFVMFFLVFFSQHLVWNPVGGELILNIQGRYLIPFAPLLFLTFAGLYSLVNNSIRIGAVCLSTCLLIFYSLWIVYERYF